MKIFLKNVGKYNEGELVGEWVELPVSQGELQEVFDHIGINEEYEEYFITDYDCDDMEDVAYQVVEDCGYLDKVPDNVARYFDYESFGRELGIGGNYIFLDGSEVIEICQK